MAGPLTHDRAIPLAPIALSEPAAGTLVKGDRLVVEAFEASPEDGQIRYLVKIPVWVGR